MAISKPVLVVRGDHIYGDFIDRLATLAGRSNRSDLVDHAIRELAAKYKMRVPDRVKPIGSNQHSAGVVSEAASKRR
jgi:metal-responsive CopG/Arc/MetJ family transcriptional regulator